MKEQADSANLCTSLLTRSRLRLLRVPEIVLKLLREPAVGANCHLRTDTRAFMEKVRRRFSAHSKRACSIRHRQVQRLKAERFEHFARMWWVMHGSLVAYRGLTFCVRFS